MTSCAKRWPSGRTCRTALAGWRWIGAANGANPIAIVVPCHRVIASNGDLKGYAWGLHRKRWLLEHENAMVAKKMQPETQTAMLPGF